MTIYPYSFDGEIILLLIIFIFKLFWRKTGKVNKILCSGGEG